jgi:hypothetical protein
MPAVEAGEGVYRKKVEEGLEKKATREKRERDEYWRKEGRKRRIGSEDVGVRERKGTKRERANDLDRNVPQHTLVIGSSCPVHKPGADDDGENNVDDYPEASG